MFSGSHVAIVTPFRNGRVDERALGDLIEFQIANGTDGIVPCGTTGESATLSHEEHKLVVAVTIEAVKRRVPVIAGSVREPKPVPRRVNSDRHLDREFRTNGIAPGASACSPGSHSGYRMPAFHKISGGVFEFYE